MALHSRDALTVSAAVATQSRADCSSTEGHTSLSAVLVSMLACAETRLFRNCLLGLGSLYHMSQLAAT